MRRPVTPSTAYSQGERDAWIDRQMRRSMFQTILTGIAAGLGTTASTLIISVIKWLFIVAAVWLRS